ncbi:MAG: Lsr2 family protein [Actinomycetes bacterium]
MAQKVQIVLIDDIDDGPADETVLFSLDGTSYEIDLSTRNAARLRASFAEFVGHARKAQGRAAIRRPRSSRSGKSAEIRAWARQQGLAVNERGRIPADLAAKFEAAQ